MSEGCHCEQGDVTVGEGMSLVCGEPHPVAKQSLCRQALPVFGGKGSEHPPDKVMLGLRLCRLARHRRGTEQSLRKDRDLLVLTVKGKTKIRTGTWPTLSPDLCINWKTESSDGILSNSI